MKRTKKQRVKHFKDVKPKHAANRLAQGLREDANKLVKRTPWQKAKDKRYHSADRIAKRNAWLKNRARAKAKEKVA